MIRRVLELREMLLGPEHQSTLISIHSLVDVFTSQGKYKAAEERAASAKAIREGPRP